MTGAPNRAAPPPTPDSIPAACGRCRPRTMLALEQTGRHEMTATADAAVEGSCLDPGCPRSWAASRWLGEVVNQ